MLGGLISANQPFAVDVGGSCFHVWIFCLIAASEAIAFTHCSRYAEAKLHAKRCKQQATDYATWDISLWRCVHDCACLYVLYGIVSYVLCGMCLYACVVRVHVLCVPAVGKHCLTSSVQRKILNPPIAESNGKTKVKPRKLCAVNIQLASIGIHCCRMCAMAADTYLLISAISAPTGLWYINGGNEEETALR